MGLKKFTMERGIGQVTSVTFDLLKPWVETATFLLFEAKRSRIAPCYPVKTISTHYVQFP
jgi:hypothetical protein